MTMMTTTTETMTTTSMTTTIMMIISPSAWISSGRVVSCELSCVLKDTIVHSISPGHMKKMALFSSQPKNKLFFTLHLSSQLQYR